MGSRTPKRKQPAWKTENAGIARELRTDSEALRYAEWWVRKRIYGLADEELRWLRDQYIAAYRNIMATLHDAYDEYGQPILAQRARLLAQIEREIDALAEALAGRMETATFDALKQGYFGRAWLLDTVTVAEWRAARHTLLPVEQIRAMLLSEYIGADDWIDLERSDLINRIKRSLTQALIQGEGMEKARARLVKELGITPGQTKNYKGSMYRALLIARTEIQRAANLGALTVYEQNRDVLRGYEFIATRDERTCPICGGLDGKVFEFNSPEAKLPPSDTHPGCRCTIVPVLIDTDLMTRVAGVRQTYREWAFDNGVWDDGGLMGQKAVDAHGLNTTSARGS